MTDWFLKCLNNNPYKFCVNEEVNNKTCGTSRKPISLNSTLLRATQGDDLVWAIAKTYILGPFFFEGDNW